MTTNLTDRCSTRCGQPRQSEGPPRSYTRTAKCVNVHEAVAMTSGRGGAAEQGAADPATSSGNYSLPNR